MNAYDVVVVGSGPAGACAARCLAAEGLSVALLEKECIPRPKVCGGGIIHRARLMLDVDLAPVVRGECRTAAMSLITGGVSYTVSRDEPIVSMVMRADFDALLVEKACAAGTTLVDGCTVEAAAFDDGGVTLQTSQGPFRASLVIAADGANSSMARLAGWPRLERLAPALECELAVSTSDYGRFDGCARFDFDMPSRGYAWVFPKGDHLGVGIGGFGVGGGKVDLKRSLVAYLQWLGLPAPAHVSGYVIPLLPRAGGFMRHRVFLTGDAAGVADPMSAEGISHAIHTGTMAARAILDGGLDAAEAAARYQSAMETELLPELAASRKLARLFYASPTIRTWLMRQYGERMVHAMAGIMMGERRYCDAVASFLDRLKRWRRN